MYGEQVDLIHLTVLVWLCGVMHKQVFHLITILDLKVNLEQLFH